MTILFYAQPYDISAQGFYFRTIEEFNQQASEAKNSYGKIVEEFELQFIDGDSIDCDLAKAWGINQSNIARFIERVDEWEKEEKILFILAVGECGFDFDLNKDPSDEFDIDIYYLDSILDLAIEFVDEGLFGEIPERLQYFIDYDAIARDLSVEYSEIIIGGECIIYRCG